MNIFSCYLKNVKSWLFCLTRIQNFTLPLCPDLTSRLTASYFTAAWSAHPVERQGHHWCILTVRYGRRYDQGPGTKRWQADGQLLALSTDRVGGGGFMKCQYRWRHTPLFHFIGCNEQGYSLLVEPPRSRCRVFMENE